MERQTENYGKGSDLRRNPISEGGGAQSGETSSGSPSDTVRSNCTGVVGGKRIDRGVQTEVVRVYEPIVLSGNVQTTKTKSGPISLYLLVLSVIFAFILGVILQNPLPLKYTQPPADQKVNNDRESETLGVTETLGITETLGVTKQRISIFIIGKSGSGKSTLVEGLLGFDEKEIQRRRQIPAIPTISTENLRIADVEITLYKWGAPESTEEKDLEKDTLHQIQGVDFVLFAWRMDDSRLRPLDLAVAKKMGKIFGKDMWEKTVVALTYANKVDYIDSDGNVKKSKEYLEKRLKTWEQYLHTFFKEENISEDTIKDIPLVPAGYFASPLLYQESWMNILIGKILDRIQTDAVPLVKEVLMK